MKKLYFLVLMMLFGIWSSNAQNEIVVIPDASFKAILLQSSITSNIAYNNDNIRIKIDTNDDGEFQENELQAVYNLTIPTGFDILDLTGIEYFINLKKLTLTAVSAVSLDLSMLGNLEKVALYATDIENIQFSSANVSLKVLDIAGNHLTSLDVSGITTLEQLYCENNELISLDVSGCVALVWLTCFENNLSSLDLSGLENLSSVSCDNNQLTSLIFDNNTALETVNCEINQLSTIDLSGIPNVKSFDCKNNQLVTINGISNLQFIKHLQCQNNQLTSLDVTGANNLWNLNCSSNQINVINGLSGLNSLVYFLCSDNALTNLNLVGNSNLKALTCTNNQINNINLSGLGLLENLVISDNLLDSLSLTGLQSLKRLECENNLLTTLNVTGLTALKTINCKDNLLTSLDLMGLNVLYDINCSYNSLNTLSFSSQNSIGFFDCSHNSLVSMTFPEQGSILHFDCSFNQFTSLDISSFCIKYLSCNNNQLTSLLLNCIEGNFDCSNNQLSVLNIPAPTSPPGNGQTGISINCSNNLLETLTIPENHDYPAYNINCNNNNLVSLLVKDNYGSPYGEITFEGNPTLQYICADFSEIDFLKDLAISYGNNNTEVNSYCSFTPGNYFNFITGKTSIDTDLDGCSGNDLIFSNAKLNIFDGFVNGILISDATGNYNIPVQAGYHTITPMFENIDYFTVSPESVGVYFIGGGSSEVQNFCITPNGIHADLEVAILPTTPARPGFDADYKIILKNKGNIQQSGSVSFAYNDAILDYEIANPVFTTQAEGSLSWAFADLQPFETREINLTLNVNSPMETPAVNGDDVLTYTATITSDQADELPLDNTFSLPQLVVNSFDPNDKTCLEGTAITPDMIGKYVHYMIRFENTGTFAAENIVVKDMIDTEKFDVSSLIALSGSHSYITRINGNKVEFIFEGINLPFEDATNDGYVVFKIKTLPTLALGDSFSNSASIYFDYNHPIDTEPAVTTFAELGTEDFEFNHYFTLYPNPTSNILNITSKQNIELQSISIYNVLGQMVVSVPNAKGLNNVDVSSLSTGNYFIKVVSDKGTSNSKFIKQ